MTEIDRIVANVRTKERVDTIASLRSPTPVPFNALEHTL
jgi:hypothetical protein